jgi:hypothetical protein
MEINYRKNDNRQLFDNFNNSEFLDIENSQNYFPLYTSFFNLNTSNYNAINLNNKYSLESILEKINYNKFLAKITDICNNKYTKEVFIKYSPLIDPVKYMIGKYENNYNILELPKFIDNTNLESGSAEYINNYKKILDPNNSAYIDGFFSYLSSCLLHKFNFTNGLDYYGAFLGIKNKFRYNATEDLEYLNESEFFHKHKTSLFVFDDNEKIFNLFNNTKKNKKPLILDKTSDDLNISDLNISDLNINDTVEHSKSPTNEPAILINTIVIEETHNTNLELTYENLDILVNNKNTSNSNTNTNTGVDNTNSSDTCSSRSSNTNLANSLNSSTDDDESSESSFNSEDVFCSIHKIPVKMIILECCENTLDDYIVNNKIKDNEWESIIMQILFTLITYQKVFEFTHNDLHTNNIVYVSTPKLYLYYKYNNCHYKVPTFGKIYKIIDFGRAIYKFKGNFICSDSYSDAGDATTQYNCEPYLNKNKPIIGPNYSFDLCRLGCSLFDYFIDDLDDIKKLKSPIKKIMIEWVFDDNNKNILYKNNGSERYPDFKLYKMIARTVHKHTPQNVIQKSVFDNYKVPRKKINNIDEIFNIDNLPIMTH